MEFSLYFHLIKYQLINKGAVVQEAAKCPIMHAKLVSFVHHRVALIATCQATKVSCVPSLEAKNMKITPSLLFN